MASRRNKAEIWEGGREPVDAMSAQVRCPGPDKASAAARGLIGVDAHDGDDENADLIRLITALLL